MAVERVPRGEGVVGKVGMKAGIGFGGAVLLVLGVPYLLTLFTFVFLIIVKTSPEAWDGWAYATEASRWDEVHLATAFPALFVWAFIANVTGLARRTPYVLGWFVTVGVMGLGAYSFMRYVELT